MLENDKNLPLETTGFKKKNKIHKYMQLLKILLRVGQKTGGRWVSFKPVITDNGRQCNCFCIVAGELMAY